MRIGVEVGGTFTDLVWEHEGELGVVKVPSTGPAPELGALAALDRVPGGLAALGELVHGSTVATNAILERRGGRVGLLVTRGTRDLLRIQRHNRRRIYDLRYRKPEPVVAPDDVLEVDERVDAAGAVIVPLDLEHTGREIDRWFEGRELDAVAICLLNAHASPEHERRLRALVQARRPVLPVSCSSDVAPEFREYERCTTTALAAYVQPVVARYLRRFGEALTERGHAGGFSVMQSNGGRLPAEAMAANAIRALLSGPAAGVVGATRTADRAGHRDVITLDMGGTSTDVCLVEDAEPKLTGTLEVDGLPIRTPAVDMVTVGAGGGSIVWMDEGGMLRVGPRSAGADPGPACYGRGATRATVTDAHLVRGTLRADALLGGEMAVDLDAARRALAPIARALDLPVEQAADAAIRVAEASIVRAIQRVSTERGRDPRRYALVPFGGAGPMMAVRVAEELGIATVLVPPHAGVLSALGLLACDTVHFETRTRRLPVDESGIASIRDTVAELAQRARDRLAGLGLAGEPRPGAGLEMRYEGQAFEIPVDVTPALGSGLHVDGLRRAFRQAHREVFEFDKGTHGACEVVSFRVSAALAAPPLPPARPRGNGGRPRAEIRILERGVERACRRLAREGVGDAVEGPVLIEDATSTLFVPERWVAGLHPSGSLLVTPG